MKNKTYIVKVNTDLTIEREEFDSEDSLAQLQRAVGGCIERYPTTLRHGLDLFVNEEGRILSLPANKVISMICSLGEDRIRIVLGNAVFASFNGDGETLGLSEEEADNLIDIMQQTANLVRTAEAEM